MKLVVGLGNPGKKYEKTRHNVGFMILDKLKEKLPDTDNWSLSKKFNASICGYTKNGEKIILAKPMTYMNASGQSVAIIAHFYKITERDLIVVHDEKDLELGQIKVQTNRGHAGHNGIKSIMENIGTKEFTRIRVGIASTNKKKMDDTANFVLGKFGIMEKKALRITIDTAVEEILRLL
ncbi:MAG: aminoacyl-tRNA hydrolase [Candidatus Magasanikbacteria bacterium CG11_big_fil_rev_8_21_14_0_20_39_34]|uniref:Peptidyl-tRNA hydrolase n=1 Tax=Candidatus Magasanikbacteria bacterium CG11_big_fil_rev_8_21_14_0_20_39_34 TaxID=1974653 RepID=A0A2H0N4N3_9BACT|nr:MAG: aminoacyl-tRNA hydrolase [Candidatus Magasanikbacteria bacterium CG11_big_fil_rev_8_21_14_0_20_39_34]